MAWSLDSERPIYSQLAEEISLRIFSGSYPAGSNLPSIRDLAQEASVNPNTMQRALSKLEEEKLIETERTSGKRVTSNTHYIDEARKKAAHRLITDFFKTMGNMGFNESEALALANSIFERGKE